MRERELGARVKRRGLEGATVGEGPGCPSTASELDQYWISIRGRGCPVRIGPSTARLPVLLVQSWNSNRIGPVIEGLAARHPPHPRRPSAQTRI